MENHEDKEEERGRRRIAVLGGGMASVSALLALTSQPDHRRRYDITVYQLGWRLGGKGASARDPQTGRIEEHGLHLFYGFYDNAFRVMKEVYAALGEDWREHFAPQDMVLVEELLGDGWHHWPVEHPRMAGEPGDGVVLPSPAQTVAQMLEATASFFTHAGLAVRPAHALNEAVDEEAPSLRRLAAEGARKGIDGLLRSLAHRARRAEADSVLLRAAQRIVDGMTGRRWSPRQAQTAAWLLERYRAVVRGRARAHGGGVTAVRMGALSDLGLTGIIGVLRDDLVDPEGRWDFHRIDDIEFKEWLRRHGALPTSVQSSVLSAMYDAAFSRRDGVAAGTALHACLRMTFTYRGSFFWKMRAGMGETIFAPIYRVLRERGVRFRFFHRVDALRCDGDRITAIELGRQATPKADYDPLIVVDGTPCWPPRPRFEQLVEGVELEASGADLEDAWTDWRDPAAPVRLEVDRDFDEVILGISVAALRHVAGDLAQSWDRFDAMIRNVRTTATQAAQLYLRPTLPELGYRGPSPIAIQFAAPFDTWADMSHLGPVEGYPRDAPAGFTCYLCTSLDEEGAAPEPGIPSSYPARLHGRARSNLEDWLTREAPGIWPGLGEEPCAALCDPLDRDGVERLDAQWVCVPRNLSDRYVLCAPGTTRYRLRVDETPWTNLWLAGDWTRTSMNIGCIEAAVMSGLEVAARLGDQPVAITGDWLGALPRERPLPHEDPISQLAPLVRRPGELRAMHPYVARDHDMHAFALGADMAALEALVDRTLNLGGPVRFRPLIPVVMFAASHVGAMRSLDGDGYGWCAERDYGFWLPLVAERLNRRGAWEPERIVTFISNLWVDSGAAAEGGREIYGFPKAVGVLRGPGDHGAPRFTVDTFAVTRRCQGAEAVTERLVEVARLEGGPRRSSPIATGLLADVLRSLPGLSAARRALVDDLLFRTHQGQVPFVFLKQFPSIESPRRACYQAVVEAPAQIAGPVDWRPLEGRWELRLRQAASHPLAEALGLRGHLDGDCFVAPALAAVRSQFDFFMHAGTVIYERPAPLRPIAARPSRSSASRFTRARPAPAVSPTPAVEPPPPVSRESEHRPSTVGAPP